ncbi:MAG: hypothetical protein JXR37_06915 [Kiritimatiellae bacterium]|nr:hypothetical protein [Kiritimatiellia bacterium]
MTDSKKWVWLAVAVLVILPLALFLRFLVQSDTALISNDDSYGAAAEIQRSFPRGMMGAWLTTWWLGQSRGRYPVSPHYFLIGLLPPERSITLCYALYLGAAGVALFFALRRMRLGVWGALWGALAFPLAGPVISIVYAGHLAKLATPVWLCLSLYFLWGWYGNRRWYELALAIAALAPALLAGDQQILVYFLLLYGAAGVVMLAEHLRRGSGRTKALHAARSAGAAAAGGALCVVLAMQTLGSAWRTNIEGGLPQEETPKARWDWATSWSYPPEEAVVFLFPQFFGYRSHEPEAPYWGRFGRSPDYEEKAGPFFNFRLDSMYLGVPVVIFALFALCFCASRWRWFWAAGFLVSFLLACGRYTPLYALLYRLPLMPNFRVPAKFLWVTAFCLAVLSAMGLDRFMALIRSSFPAPAAKRVRLFAVSVLAVMVIVAVVAGVWGIEYQKSLPQMFAEGAQIPDSARNLVRALAENDIVSANLKASLIRALCMTLLCCAGIWAGPMRIWREVRPLLAVYTAGWLLAMSLDLVQVDRQYLQPYNWKHVYGRNPITDFLREQGTARVKFLARHGVFNNLMSLTFWAGGLETIDIPAVSRAPADYMSFFEAFAAKPLDMFRLCNVRFALSDRPVQGLTPLQQWPLGDGQRIVCSKLPEPMPRAWFVARARFLANEQVYAELKQGVNPQACVLLDKTAEEHAPAGAGADAQPAYRPAPYHRPADDAVVVELDAPAPGWVVVADKYDADWRATVDGRRAPVCRAYGIMRAVPVAAGRHRIEMAFRPARGPFYTTLAGWLLWLAAMAAYAVMGRERGSDRE